MDGVDRIAALEQKLVEQLRANGWLREDLTAALGLIAWLQQDNADFRAHLEKTVTVCQLPMLPKDNPSEGAHSLCGTLPLAPPLSDLSVRRQSESDGRSCARR